ncbi:MAG: hypothetical protein Q4E17_07565 [Synergistes sp.]|nr:hypothetical protein [Synergistes sp.]
MNAILGPSSSTGRNVAAMDDPYLSKYTGGFKARTIMEFVDSDANLKKEVSVAASVGASGSIGKTPLKICDKHDWANNSSFSEHTTTLIIKYERLSNQYLDGTNVKLTDEAKQALNSDGSAGKVAFRKKFGDYYLAGYQKGAQCVVTVTIKAKSKEEINTVRNTLNASIGPVKLDNDFKKKLEDALSHTTISYKCNLVGGDDIPLPHGKDGNLIGNAIDNVNKYISGVNLSNMAVINCHFKHISFLTDKFPDTYPAPASKRYFEKETELYNLLWSIQVRRNVIDSFNTSIFTGNKDMYFGRCDSFQGKIIGINDEAEMIRDIDKNIEEGKSVLAYLQTIVDRYHFYCKLMDIRKNWWYKNGFGDYGFKNYPESPYVHKELQDNTGGYVWNSHYKDKWKFLSYWYVYYPGEPYTLSEDYRSVYFHLERVDQYTSITDYAWDNNHGPSFGSRYLSHYWKGGVMRGIEWKMQIRALHMPRDKYPFNGLDEATPSQKRAKF